MGDRNAGRRGRSPFEGRRVRKRFLIVCEGEETEPNYFRAFPVSADVRVDVRGEGMNTISLVARAEAYVAEAAKEGRPYDQVWVVYDRDSFDADAFNEAQARIDENNGARGEEWSAGWSNEAFEVWYLLHFQYVDADLNRHLVAKKLSSRLGSCAKNDPTMYRRLKAFQADAIRNAKRLERQQGVAPHGTTTPAAARPCTRVPTLSRR